MRGAIDPMFGVQAQINAETAGLLLAEAQLQADNTNVSEQAALAGGYASLAIARQLAALNEIVSALGDQVAELTDRLAARRTPWWKSFLQNLPIVRGWREGNALGRKAVAKIQAAKAAQAQPSSSFDADVDQALNVAAPSEAAAAAPPVGEGLATVVPMPFLAGGAR
jgi:hypothetical protein